jgi:hypothetical protein
MRIILSIAFLLVFKIGAAQLNLVVNPSFEDTFLCPSNQNVTKTNHWYSLCGSPDFFFPTMTANLGCIEQIAMWNDWGGGGYTAWTNNWGSQLPHSGLSYIGEVVQEAGEVTMGILSDTLRVGKKYAVSFYCSLSDAYYTPTGGYGMDLIGFCFTKDSLANSLSNVSCLEILPYLTYDAGNQSGNFLTDTANWMLVQDTFVARGGEKYFAVGNFNAPNTQYVGSNTPTFCYYFFDDFDVHCIDCNDTTPPPPPPPPPDPQILVQPNLGNGNFPYVGEFPENSRLLVYNMLGQIVFEQYINPGYQTGNIFLPAAAGMYVYSFEAQGKILKYGKLMKGE